MMVSIARTSLRAAALWTLVSVLQVPVLATVSPDVPEISGSSISAALGLLTAGILVLRARRIRK
jgi:hypothetical protein